MSIEENQVEVDAIMARFLSGREPSQAMLDRAPTLDQWRLSVANASGGSRGISIHGTPKSDRFRVSILTYPGGWRVLWMDRRWRFALTRHRLWNLGERGVDAA
jgi:hypothetical protein